MNNSQDTMDHPVFRNNPVQLRQTLYTCMELKSADGSTHTGHVLAVDPVSESRILVTDWRASEPVVEVVFGHSITGCRAVGTDGGAAVGTDGGAAVGTDAGAAVRQVAHLLRRPHQAESLPPARLRARRDHVISWLRLHRLPVEVADEHVTVAGVARLEAPYGPEQCVCDNEVVLQRLDALLRSMPPQDELSETVPAPSGAQLGGEVLPPGGVVLPEDVH